MEYKIINENELDDYVEKGWQPISISHHPFTHIIKILISRNNDY